jgi:hypothetical protein
MRQNLVSGNWSLKTQKRESWFAWTLDAREKERESYVSMPYMATWFAKGTAAGLIWWAIEE